MKIKTGFRGILFFLAGFLAASALQFSFSDKQNVLADQYGCIRQDLDAWGMTGNIPDPEFTICYHIPSCYASSGYKVEKVFMYGNDVAVRYKNPNAPSSMLNGIQGGFKTRQGGFRTIP